MNPHSFLADPDPAVFLNADSDRAPAGFLMQIRIQLRIFFFLIPYEYEEISEVNKFSAEIQFIFDTVHFNYSFCWETNY